MKNIIVDTSVWIDCMRRVHTPPLWGVKKGMYPEANTLPKQPYPVRSAAGLVDFFNKKNISPETIILKKLIENNKKINRLLNCLLCDYWKNVFIT